MRTLRITLAYDGTNYHGWQVQPGLLTIQGEMQRVLGEIEKRPVHVMASGRTDAGVHALGQVAAFELSNPIPCENLRRALNRLLPTDIRVLEVREASARFHPRYHAVAKTYEYQIFREEVLSPFERYFVHHHPYPLDEEAIIDAAEVFEGEHDFTAFAASDEKDSLSHSKVRRIFSSRCERTGGLLIYRVRGSGFLKYMVRNLVGTLLEVGKGNWDRKDLIQMLQSGYPSKAGPTAPPQGLFLISVEYEDPQKPEPPVQ